MTKELSSGWKVVVIFAAGALVGALSVVEIVPDFVSTSAEQGVVGEVGDDGLISGSDDILQNEELDGGKGGKGKQNEGSGTAAGGDGVLPPSKAGLECAAGKNGGATDQGVTATSIKMATTVAESGIGAAFLGEVRFAMEAVRNAVNRAGGICGRMLEIEYRDDAWSAQTGAQYLRNFMQEGIFAIPVCPSSEGCRVVIESGDLDGQSIPMVGSDGMLESQYVRRDGKAQPWVWPVATATVSSARIMASHAYKRGARNFSIVFDKNYRFGVEAAEAFNAEVKRLTGKGVAGYNSQYNCQENFCGVNAGRSSYSSEVATFKEGDYVALFLEPQTALAWMNDPNAARPSQIKYGYGGAQPLFTRDFAVNCQAKCDQMMVWTGFKPYIESYKNDPRVKAYVSDLKRTKPDADEFNAFTQGGYVGMQLLVDALKRVGPELTRERLQTVLNVTSLKTGLTLQDRIGFSPTSRFSNVTMQGFTIQYKGTFGGWRAGPTVRDPRF